MRTLENSGREHADRAIAQDRDPSTTPDASARWDDRDLHREVAREFAEARRKGRRS